MRSGGGEVNRPGVPLAKRGRTPTSGERWIRVFRKKEIDAAASLKELRKGKRLRSFSGEGTQQPQITPALRPRNLKLSENGRMRSCKLPPSSRVLPGKENAEAVQTMKERLPAVELPGQIIQSSLPVKKDGVEEESTEKFIDFLSRFSKKPDKRLESVDFMEVLSMKGIHIAPPRWWRPGGYAQGRNDGVNNQVLALSQVKSDQVQGEQQGTYPSTKRYLQPRRTPRMRVIPDRQVFYFENTSRQVNIDDTRRKDRICLWR